jgi:spermidine synthase
MLAGFRAEAYERAFATRYYNAGIHQAAFASPEFLLKMRL